MKQAKIIALLLFGLCAAILALAPTSQPVARAQTALPTLTATEAYPNLASNFSTPVALAHAGDERLFVVEKGGQIQVLPLAVDTAGAATFLNISSAVESTCNECGLLGLAFHPDYARNGRFFVNYTHTDSSNDLVTRISEFSVSADPNQADANSETILLEVAQPFTNHNGGDLAFGPDGYLYIALGDGGSGGDPQDNAQNPRNLLGTLLRLDVNGRGLAPECDPDGNYTIPTDNPFVDGGDSRCDEIWAFGLRNPWRFGFDAATGDLFIGDVGQNAREEVNYQPAGSSGGENYGWNCYEGTQPYTGANSNPDVCGSYSSYTGPIFDYPHDDDGSGTNHGRSVTGGDVYRGQLYPGMVGHYLVADFISANFWSLNHDGSGWLNSQATAHGSLSGVGNPSTFGADVRGELYVASYSNGRIYQLGDGSPRPDSLAVTKSGPTAVFAPATTITYTLTVANLASEAAANLVITDTLPSGTTYVGSSPTGAVNNGVITWNVPELTGRDSLTLSLTVSLDPAQAVIINDSYSVAADGVVQAAGAPAVVTLQDPAQIFLPIVQR